MSVTLIIRIVKYLLIIIPSFNLYAWKYMEGKDKFTNVSYEMVSHTVSVKDYTGRYYHRPYLLFGCENNVPLIMLSTYKGTIPFYREHQKKYFLKVGSNKSRLLNAVFNDTGKGLILFFWKTKQCNL